MRLATIAFLVGILLCQTLAELPASWWALVIVPLLVVGVKSQWLRFPAFILIGFLWVVFRADSILSVGLLTELEGQDVSITGTIASLPERRAHGVRFEFDVLQLTYNGQAYPGPGRVRLGWYKKPPELVVGDRWRLTVRLKRPYGFMNPGGFDYERWLFQNRIRATGYVREDAGNSLLNSDKTSHPVQRLRQYLKYRLDSILHGRSYDGIIKALAIGERDGISQAQWDVFNRTGTSHLVAISGLHIGLIAAFLFFVVKATWGRLAKLALVLSASRVGYPPGSS